MNTDYDSPWKDFLQKYLQDVFELLFPVAAEQIDWTRGTEFLEQELRQIMPESEQSKRIADALVRVYLKTGKEQWELIHNEVQGQRDDDFPERMFVSWYRIFDRYKQRVAGFAIFSDDDVNWHPREYVSELLGARIEYRFNTAKLMLLDNIMLADSYNPFAWVILAHRAAQRTSKNPQARLRMKIRLTQQLAEKHYPKAAIHDLYRFMDWVMKLPDLEAIQYKEEIKKLEAEPMTYISTIEQMGIEKGIEKGIETERIGLIMRLLERFIGPVSIQSREAIERLNNDTRLQLVDDLLDFKHPDDLNLWLLLHPVSAT